MSRRVFAPAKTAARSAWTAAGPVTWAVTPSGRSALTRRPDLLDGLGGRRRVVGVDRHDGEQRRAVLAALHRRPAGAGHLGEPGLDGGHVARRQLSGVGAEEHDGRRPLGLGQLLAQLDGRGAVGADGQGVGRRRGAGRLPDDADDSHRPARARMTMATAHHLRVILSVTERTTTSARMSNLVTQKITKLVSDISSNQSDRQPPPVGRGSALTSTLTPRESQGRRRRRARAGARPACPTGGSPARSRRCRSSSRSPRRCRRSWPGRPVSAPPSCTRSATSCVGPWGPSTSRRCSG